jgi:hypothetical protein
LDLAGFHRPRSEKLTDAYARIYKTEVDAELQKAYAEHAEKEGEDAQNMVVFRGPWLQERWEGATKEVQEKVKRERRTAEDKLNSSLSLKWDDEEDCGEEELKRRAEAYRVHV